jgi:hypothetical protein
VQKRLNQISNALLALSARGNQSIKINLYRNKAIKKIPGCMTYVVHPEIGKLNNLEVFESK